MHTLCIETATIIKLVQQAEDIRCFIWDGPLGIHRQSPIVPFLEIHTLYRAFYPIHKGTVFSGVTWGLPWWLRRLSVCLQCRRPGFNPCIGKIPWRRKWQSTPGLLPGKSHGQKSLVDYSPWSLKELDTTEKLHFTSVMTFCISSALSSSFFLSSFIFLFFIVSPAKDL